MVRPGPSAPRIQLIDACMRHEMLGTSPAVFLYCTEYTIHTYLYHPWTASPESVYVGNFAVEPLVHFPGVEMTGMVDVGASDEMRVAPPSVVLEHPASPDRRGIQPKPWM